MAYYYTDNSYFQRKMDRELSIEAITEGLKNEEEKRGEEILHFLIRNQKNQKKLKKQKILMEDLERDDFLGTILREYNEALQQITEDLKEKKDDGKRYLRTRASYQIKQDMIYTKDSLEGVFGYNTRPMESTVPNLNVIDLSNPAHVKALINLRIDFDPSSDLSFILLDLEEVIQKVLDKNEKFIVEMLRDELQVKEIAEILEITYKQAQYKIRKIIEKVANY